jgi:pimeloyl-ACP methyl ester carboxylesterase
MPPRKRLSDVLVLLPGIMGSVLTKDGKEVWAPTAGAIVRGLLSLARNVKALKLDGDSPDAPDLGDGVVATRIMPDVHLIPGLWKIDGYSKTSARLAETFDLEPKRNYFEFAYDWRRDNRAAAHRLAHESAGWLRDWRERSGNDDAKLILIGHSMGGLISRYFLECLDGWRDTRLLVTFGTPYRGSLKAVATLANGVEKGIGPLTVDLSELVRSMTSVYQLLPIYPCCEGAGSDLVRVGEANIPHIPAQRAEAALAFHDEIRDAVDAHNADDEYVRDRYGIRPVIGTVQPTAQSARLAGQKIELVTSYKGEDQGGDGTVPRVSATPLELEHEEGGMFVAQRHASLQNDDPVLVQLAGILSGLDLDLSAFRALTGSGLGLDVDDAYATDEPVQIHVHPEEEPARPLEALVEDVSHPTGGRDAEVARTTLRRADDGIYEAELGPFPEGGYRLTVMGGGEVEPVTDVFVVLSDAG